MKKLIFFAAVAVSIMSWANGPQTFCRFVPERKDDFAWENDKIAFRAYGPALRDGQENSGIDCWLKCVDYPIIDKWYMEAQKGKSYHTDHGEGYDPYHVGSSAGCGGTALWVDGKREPLETFVDYEVLDCGPDQCRFKLAYEKEVGGVVYGEARTFTIETGKRLFDVHSTFTIDGEPAADLPVCIGVTTHEGKADPSSSPDNGWIACSERIDGHWLGTAAMIDPARLETVKIVESKKKDVGHIFVLCRTDANGALNYQAGYAWEKAGEITTESEWHQYLNNK